jgi:hypothetical protein
MLRLHRIGSCAALCSAECTRETPQSAPSCFTTQCIESKACMMCMQRALAQVVWIAAETE